MGQASKGYWGLAKETTPGTAVAPNTFYPVINADTDFENQFIMVKEIRGSRQAYRNLDGAVEPSHNVSGLVYPSGALGKLFYGLLGSDSSAAEGASTTAYRHTFGDAAALPYWTLERSDAFQGEGGLLCERVAGAKVESISLNCAFGEEITFEAAFQALKKPATATPQPSATVTSGFPTMNPLVFKGASIEVDDVVNSHFKSLNLELTNELTRQNALNGSQESYKIFEGGLECSLSGTMVFEDMSMYTKLINSTAFKLELIITGDVADAVPTPDVLYTLKFTWDIVKVANYSVPFEAGEVVEADVDFSIDFSNTNNRIVLVEMINLDATDYDA